jgi:hypothetical protein
VLIRVRLGREALRRGSWQPGTWHHGTRVTRDGSAGGRGHIESIPVLIPRWGAPRCSVQNRVIRPEIECLSNLGSTR